MGCLYSIEVQGQKTYLVPYNKMVRKHVLFKYTVVKSDLFARLSNFASFTNVCSYMGPMLHKELWPNLSSLSSKLSYFRAIVVDAVGCSHLSLLQSLTESSCFLVFESSGGAWSSVCAPLRCNFVLFGCGVIFRNWPWLFWGDSCTGRCFKTPNFRLCMRSIGVQLCGVGVRISIISNWLWLIWGALALGAASKWVASDRWLHESLVSLIGGARNLDSGSLALIWCAPISIISRSSQTSM